MKRMILLPCKQRVDVKMSVVFHHEKYGPLGCQFLRVVVPFWYGLYTPLLNGMAFGFGRTRCLPIALSHPI
jgi:hypothetical protein